MFDDIAKGFKYYDVFNCINSEPITRIIFLVNPDLRVCNLRTLCVVLARRGKAFAIS